jgi:hypothetical protein
MELDVGKEGGLDVGNDGELELEYIYGKTEGENNSDGVNKQHDKKNGVKLYYKKIH